MKYAWRPILRKNIEERYIQHPEEWYDLSFSTNDLVDITVVSERFANVPHEQRLEQVQDLLRESDAPVRIGLYSLRTLSEADSIRIPRPTIGQVSRVYNWLDLADQAINASEYLKFQRSEPRVPRTVTFYSFKRGVGCTTALIHVAWLLALCGRKVVAVDFDVEAPGLSSLLRLTPMLEHGTLDYFYERPQLLKGVEPTFSIPEMFSEIRVPNASGKLFVVPAGSLNLDYMTKIDNLRPFPTTVYGENLWSLFFREMTEQLQPDIILVDSSAGFSSWGAFSLLRAADQAIVFLYPNEQNKRGIDLLLEALVGTIPLQFVFSPVPFGDAGTEKVRAYWQSLQSGLASDQTNSDENKEIPEIETQPSIAEPIIIPYLTELALASSYPVMPLLPNYMDIANVIDEGITAVSLKDSEATN